MNEQIKFSIIIATYKRSEKLPRAIESVLNQNYDNYEIIVVDDNDEESIYREQNKLKLEKYLKDSLIVYLKHKKNMNGAVARNTGIKVAKGEYITFLDDDDEFENNRLKIINEIIQTKNKPDFIYTGYQVKRNGIITKKIKKQKKYNKRNMIYSLLCQKSFIGTGSNIVCKKSIINTINGFDETFIRHQDIEFLIRYLDISNSIENINEILVTKNNDDNMNVPDVYSLLKTKEKFLNKYKYIINRYTLEEQKSIYYYNYYELLNIAYMKNNKDDICMIIDLLKQKKMYNLILIKKIMIKQFVKRIIMK